MASPLRELQESPLIVISEISKGPVSIETADVSFVTCTNRAAVGAQLLISREEKRRPTFPNHFYIFVTCHIISMGWHAQRRVYRAGYEISNTCFGYVII
jgi:hypothetical protein